MRILIFDCGGLAREKCSGFFLLSHCYLTVLLVVTSSLPGVKAMLRPESWSRLAVERRRTERVSKASLRRAGRVGDGAGLEAGRKMVGCVGEQPGFGWLVGRAQAGRPAEG